ncbi:MAG: hypothetical protein ACLTON_04375 [Christensenellales bacterium]
MKITDFALIFVGITLPIIITVYVNVSFTIKAEEQEMYYKKIINAALDDASNQMKEVENSDKEIDYGYSGTSDNKISVNAQVGVDTFLNSLYNNFGIKGNDTAENYLQYFIPAIAIIDYNGVQVSSIEEFTENGQNVIKHVLKPKKYYSYTYYLCATPGDVSKLTYTEDYETAVKNGLHSTHIVEFTMDDYITHRGYINEKSGKVTEIPVSSFYISDSKNNSKLVANVDSNASLLQREKNVLSKIISNLQNKRKSVIINSIQDEMEYATNNNNSYASQAGIRYNFVFPTLEEGEMESQIQNVGIMALVQGISIGNRYLNVRAYSTSKLTEITRYYLSIPNTDGIYKTKYNLNLYHKDKNCPEYRAFASNKENVNITPSFLFTKQQAASVKAVLKKDNTYIQLEGFYPCPVCNP